jgi:hypothetical protein
MTVTVNKISKPKPPTNPLAFDPDTQPGDLVMCIDADAGLMRGEVYTFLKHYDDDYLSVKEIPNVWHFTFFFINVHRLPDGKLAFGRGPAGAKPEPKLYTTDEVHTAPVGSLFANADQKQFNKGQNHALRIVADLLGTSMPTHQNVASKIEALQKRADNATRIARTRGDEIKALQARVDALENGLRDIAGQRRIAEIVEHHGYEKLDECDFEGAYDILITIARAALETRKETP